METVLLDLDNVKDHLQVDHDFDDDYIFRLMEDAQKLFENYVERPIFSDIEMDQSFHGGDTKLILDYFPVDPASVVVEDTVRDVTLDSSEFKLDNRLGFVYRVSSFGSTPKFFSKGINRWKVTYRPGIIHHPQWSTYKEEALKASFRDLVADFYEIRTPGMREERLGGGSVLAYRPDEIAPRIRMVWDTIGRDLNL